MHIALLGPIAPPAGGVQSHMASLRDRLIDHGHRVSMVAITRSERVAQPDVYYPGGPLALLKTVRALKPDIVHLHVGGDLTTRVAAMSAALRVSSGARIILTFHSGGFPASPAGQRASATSPVGVLLRGVDYFIAVNAEIAALFRRYGIRDEQIDVIAPHARVNPKSIAFTLPDDIEEFYSAHAPVLIAVGMLEPEYSLELQIEAIATLRQSLPRIGLLLVGSGSLVNALERQILDRGLESHVRLHGNLEHSLTLRAIQRADVLLRTTKFDGDAVSVREALQLGTAVVASRTAFRPEGVTLLESLNADSIARACERALEARELTEAVEVDDELDRVLARYEASARQRQA